MATNKVEELLVEATSLATGLEVPAGAEPYEESDFTPYIEEFKTEEELQKSWRVFTKVKDVLDNGRRLENMSWRLWQRERARSAADGNHHAAQDGVPAEAQPPSSRSPPNGARHRRELSQLEAFDRELANSLQTAQQETDRMAGEMFGGLSSKFEAIKMREVRDKQAERAQRLVEIKKKHMLQDGALDDVLAWVAEVLDSPDARRADSDALIPKSVEDAMKILETNQIVPRKKCATFGHSLERNGANNFLLYLVRELRDLFIFDIFAPKEGPMKQDYEGLGMTVRTLDPQANDYGSRIRDVLREYEFTIANTIMTTEVVIASGELKIPNLWVIHEAWPKDQFEYYAKEVFLMKHLDSRKIISAFRIADKIVFPAKVQQKCYDGLFEPSKARVIYNGIPLASINAFRAVQSREKVRSELGYGKNDLVILHIGTVCKRKAQLVTAKAFSRVINECPLENKHPKLLMVGARYIRQHEIEYIDAIKAELRQSGAFNFTKILDVHKNVLPFYLAADIVVCPSVNEVLPLVICESMAFERPVVATKIDGIPEALSDGVEGFLIEPGDPTALYEAMAKLLKDEYLRKEMGRNGRNRVLSQFSFSVMSKHYRELLFPQGDGK